MRLHPAGIHAIRGALSMSAIVDRQESRLDFGQSRRPRAIVIGGGIAGLTAAYRLAQSTEAEIVLLEREARLGGKVVTEQLDGFIIEGGPEALLTAKPAMLALCQELGLGDRLMGTNPAARGSFILRGGRLHPLPDGLGGMMPTRFWPIASSRLISPLGKGRMGLDLVLPRRGGDGDESVAAFIERRLGREAYCWLADPLVSGIYAADGHRLSLAATFPQLQALERQHGGVIRGILAAKLQAAVAAGEPRSSPFQAPRGGMTEVIDALAARLGESGARIETGVAVSSVNRAGEAYEVRLANGSVVRADAIVCAAPAPAIAEILAALDPVLAAGVQGIPYASVATVALAYAATAIPRPFTGTGYLTPRAEGRPVKACTVVSSKWAGRAPDGASLIRVSLGGAGQEEMLALEDAALLSLARDEMRDVFGIEEAPLFARLFRWPHAMPQYEPGHLERVAEIEKCVAGHPRLALAGNAYRGAGLADCVQSGEQAAANVAAGLADRARHMTGPLMVSATE